MLSAKRRIISVLASPFIDFALKNVPVTDEKLEKYGGDAVALSNSAHFCASFPMHQAGDGAAGGPLKLLYFSKCRNKDALKIDRQRLK
jgi:hypothetical protein